MNTVLSADLNNSDWAVQTALLSSTGMPVRNFTISDLCGERNPQNHEVWTGLTQFRYVIFFLQ